jgi:hypothetical protein
MDVLILTVAGVVAFIIAFAKIEAAEGRAERAENRLNGVEAEVFNSFVQRRSYWYADRSVGPTLKGCVKAIMAHLDINVSYEKTEAIEEVKAIKNPSKKLKKAKK